MQYTIGFGLGFDRDDNPIGPVQRAEALKIILTEAAIGFGGCNITFGQGAWINPTGSLVVEESAVLTIQAMPNGRLAADELTMVRALAHRIRAVLNQHSVIVGQQVGTASLVAV